MRAKFVIGAWSAALIATSVLSGADNRALIGATREQILARFGEPKSQIVAGNREVLIFPTERVILRDNRAIEIEDLAVEPPPAAPTNPTTTAPADATSDANSGQKQTATASPDHTRVGTLPSTATPTAEETAGNAAIVAPPPPQVVIKSVRPPTHTASTPAPLTPAPAPVVETRPSPKPAEPSPSATTPAAPVSEPSAVAVTPPSDASVGNAAIATEPTAGNESDATTSQATTESTATSTPAPVEPAKSAAETSAPSIAPTTPTTARETAKPKVVAEPPATAPAPGPAPRRVPFSAIAIGIIVVGIGYLIWRRRQRAALLAATAVSRSPFPVAAAVPGATISGSRFTAELLDKLEWKHFEDLVAAYYNKTGVVAARTKSGPTAPVHIRISWKGEQRPFACVQCHAHPAGLIDARPVQTLVEALAGEDIRRGYIVTSGKFGVPARDLAEEKHITLLSGDILLEKLNALPEPARAELLREATSGDYTTPTCPTCESKMSRSIGESAWTCPQCGTTLPRG